MSTIKKMISPSEDLEKVQTFGGQGDVIVLSEPLSPEEDRRILRRVDM